MALSVLQTAVGPMYTASLAGVAVTFKTQTVVFHIDRNSDVPASAVTPTSIYKYFAASANIATPAELRLRIQVSTDNTNWTTIRSASRYVGKDTFDLKDLVGSFLFGNYRQERYFQVVAELVGTPVPPATTDAVSTVSIVAGLSLDQYQATSPSGYVQPFPAIPNHPFY